MRFKRLLEYHWLLTLLVMGIAAIVFGLSSINIFFYFKANLVLIADHGTAALRAGALEELLMLLVNGFVALGAYIVIKACEKVLVDALLKKK